MTQKQQQLSFDKGITNVPSDVLCSDNALEESIGLVYDDGEHKVVQKPKTFVNGYSGEQSGYPSVVYVHSLGNEKRYIYTTPQGTQNVSLRWAEREQDDTILNYRDSLGIVLPKNSFSITSIGKTLIISGKEETHYCLWAGDEYKLLPDIPTPDVRFWLESNGSESKAQGACDDIFIINTQSSLRPIRVNLQKDAQYQNLVRGLYAELKNKNGQRNLFLNPFFACVALELYDGSFTKVSNPVLLFPSISKNHYFYVLPNVAQTLFLGAIPSYLYIDLETSYELWEDVVKNVVVFVSDEIDIIDSLDDLMESEDGISGAVIGRSNFHVNSITKGRNNNTSSGNFGGRRVRRNAPSVSDLSRSLYRSDTPAVSTFGIDPETIIFFSGLKYKEKIDVELEITSTSLFYKLCELGITEGLFNASSTARKNTVGNITTQQQLSLDFYSNCTLCATNVFQYNNRLNLIAPERGFFDGFTHFTAFDSEMQTGYYTVFVYIKTNHGERIVSKYFESSEHLDVWFYYPDPRAYKYVVFSGYNKLYEHDLIEHTGLNGAYYFGGMPSGNKGIQPGTEATMPTVISTPETLYNSIATSEANNPWVFKAEGYNNVGNGEVIGVASLTQALSQGQFGQYPLLAFCSDGIWALSVGSTGYYTSIHPMSREVCNNPKSITQTDGAVFFASEKGLMVVVGNQVKCVSEQMSGRTYNFFDGVTDMGNFRDYLKKCFIAYDYRDSLLWIFNPYSGFEEYCYLYAIKSGTFSKYFLDDAIDGVVGDYPDNLLRSGGKLFSLTGRENINDDTDEDGNVNLYSGVLISRPMKLENGLALKSIMQVKHIRDFSGNGTMTLKIYASNNLRTWWELKSLRGIPWKYYRFRYDFQNLLATDRFAGSVVVTQERRTDKLR